MAAELPIQTLHLFPVLDKMLLQLLKSLTIEEWNTQTIAKKWKVKDVAAHLLDGNLRSLSSSRDGYFGEKAENIQSYADLVGFLNHLNSEWTNATKRLSPRILISLLESSGEEYTEHLKSLNPYDKSIYSVAWADQEESENWFHIAREYTEKFLHQQQIRDALHKPGLMTKEFFYPFMDTFMYGLPPALKSTDAKPGTVVSIQVTGEIGGQWNITRTDSKWELSRGKGNSSDALVEIDPEISWKLFSKSWRPDDIMDKIVMKGDQTLCRQALEVVSVMA